jgi:uncharacterized protein YgiM (DUF1202 family)
MKFLLLIIINSIFTLTSFANEKIEKYFVNKEYTLKALAYEENNDLITVVYPGDEVELIFLEENLRATKEEDEYFAKVKFQNKEGYIPFKFLQETIPKNLPKIRKRAFVDPKKYFVTASSLYIREEPSTTSNIITSIYRNDEVIVTRFSENDDYIGGISAKWAYIESRYAEGWVFSGYLTDNQNQNTQYIAESYDQIKEGDDRFSIASLLHIRDEPSKYGTTIGIINHGSKVKIINKLNYTEAYNGMNSGWVKVSSDDIEGWVYAGFLHPIKIAKKLNDSLDKPFQFPLEPDPTKTRITSKFGPRIDPVTKKQNANHTGIDFYHTSRFGASIYAAGDGIVIHQSTNTAFGYLTIIQHENGLVTYYAHQQKFLVKQNDSIKAGDLIGELGSTGKSTGPHLHFEVRTGMWKEALNPINYIPIPEDQ